MSGVGTGFPAFLAAPIQAVIASCTSGTASSIELPTALHPGSCGTIATKQLSSAKPTSYGFLSGSMEALKLATTVKQVQIDLKDGRILDARVLQVNPIGSPWSPPKSAERSHRWLKSG